MPTEMLSGPDLGGGFLHQLTTDRDGDRSTFTYHAQDGGQDANGPPKGPLDVFGFVHPASPCPFGGPRCWHRRFLLPFSETPRVRPAYNRSRFVLQTMLDQVYSGAPIAVEPAVGEILTRLARAPGLSESGWFFSGPASAWLLGAPIAPAGVELSVTRPAVDAVGLALAEFLIEPVATTDWPDLGIVRGGRAFVGTFVAGARVEWGTPLERSEALDRESATADGPRMVVAPFRGNALRVPRPEYELARAAEQGRVEEVRALGRWLREYGVDRELLDVLLGRPAVAPTARAAVRTALDG
jgi:hypothetical protein